MADARWGWRFARNSLVELVGFAPVIALYLALAFCAACFDHFQRVWLVTFQFLVLELFACAVVAVAAFGLADGWNTGKGSAQRLLTPRERDFGLIGLALVLVALLPAGVFALTDDGAKAAGAGALFLPRCLDLWRVREQPRPVVRALAWSALSGPALLLLLVVLAMLMGAAAAGATATEVSAGSRAGGVLIASYYVVVALIGAWLRTRVEAWSR
jgi:hypothetical protein